MGPKGQGRSFQRSRDERQSRERQRLLSNAAVARRQLTVNDDVRAVFERRRRAPPQSEAVVRLKARHLSVAGHRGVRLLDDTGPSARGIDPTPQDDRASLRDANAEQRDRAADERDRTAATKTAHGEVAASTFAAYRRGAGADRADAANDRSEALRDRRSAAEAALQATQAEARAMADRDRTARDREHAQHDDLTGVFSRELGGAALENEIERARRSDESFVLGFVDVDELKALNDRRGHAAGDALLQHVAASMRCTLRSYDPIVRLGGDEFLCAFINTDLATAQHRAEEIQAAVCSGTGAGSVTVGLAELGDSDTLDSLTARANRDMYARKSHPGARTRRVSVKTFE